MRLPAWARRSMAVRITPLVISAFNIVLPAIFNFMSRFEDYLTEVTTSRVNLARSYIVKMSSIYVLLFGYLGIDRSGQLGSVRHRTGRADRGSLHGPVPR
jgi:hypothetical protein